MPEGYLQRHMLSSNTLDNELGLQRSCWCDATMVPIAAWADVSLTSSTSSRCTAAAAGCTAILSGCPCCALSLRRMLAHNHPPREGRFWVLLWVMPMHTSTNVSSIQSMRRGRLGDEGDLCKLILYHPHLLDFYRADLAHYYLSSLISPSVPDRTFSYVTATDAKMTVAAWHLAYSICPPMCSLPQPAIAKWISRPASRRIL